MRHWRVERECLVLCQHLVGQDPTDYVTRAYIDAHQAAALSREPVGIDRALLKAVRWNRWGAALADAYSGLFARRGLTRSKTVLLFGILESTAPYHRVLDDVPSGGVVRLVGLGLWGGVVAAVATLVFAPIHVFAGGTDA